MSLESVFKLSLVMNMIDNLSGPMAGIASRVGADVSKLDSMSQAFGGVAKAGVAMQEAGSQIAGAVLAPVEATFETRRALGELASLGVQDLGMVEDAARSFSDQWAGTTKADFISAAYDIKSGIASLSDEGVAGFTELAGLTAKATKSTIGEMTSLFATGYGIYKDFYGDMSDMEFGEMFSAGIAQSVKQFKTTGSGMAQSIQTLGASATTANVPLEEQLSILGMLQATMGGAEAGTKYKAFLRSAAKGGEALGLSFTDANNQLLSMPEILDILRGKFGETMDAAEKMELQKAFGDTEAVALIDLMYNKVGDLQDNIVGMYDALGSGTGVATEMASAINETEPERFQRLTQQIQNVKESIGNSLLPTVNDLMSTGEKVLTKVGSWIEENQELVRVIMLVVLAIGGFLIAAGTIAAVVGGVGLVVTKAIAAFKLLKAGFLLAKGALLPLISSVWSFTAALLANPITWIVIGIIALIAALVLLYNKCEWFRNGVNAIIDFFKEKLGAALEVVTSIFSGIGNIIGSVMDAAKATVSQNLDNMRTAYETHGGGIRGAAAAAIEGVKGVYMAGFTFLDNLTGGKLTAIKDKFVSVVSNIAAGIRERFVAVTTAFSNGITAIKNTITGAITWFFESGKRVVTTFANGIKSAFTGAVDAVKGGLQKIRNMLPFSDAKEGPLSTLTLSGQRTMTTYAHGLTLGQDAPAAAMEQGLERAKATLEREPVKKVNLTGKDTDGQTTDEEAGDSAGSGKKVIIQKLLMQVDLKKLKDLQGLLEILKEVEDYAEGNGTEEPDGDPDAVPDPA
nr:MAG TPA: tail tape measure [Caudoviricetes sp.]